MKILQQISSQTISEAKTEARPPLPEPETTTEVDFGNTETGEGAAVIVTTRYPLDYDEAAMYDVKKTKVFGESQNANGSLVTFQLKNEQTGEMETHVLTIAGRPVSVISRLIGREVKQAAQAEAEAEENSALPVEATTTA